MHKSIGRLAGAVLTAAAATAAFGAPAAHAELTSCGSSITDPAGDGWRFTVPRLLDTASEAPHYDITETFFTHGDGVMKAHIKIRDMKAEPDDVWWPTWSVNFDVGAVSYEANARMIEGSMEFYYWKFDGSADQNTGIAIPGEVVDGPGGGIVLEIPSDDIDGYAPGMTLSTVFSYTQDGQIAGATPHGYSDRAPDSGNAPGTVGECAAAPTDNPTNTGTPESNNTGGNAPAPSSAPAADSTPAPAPATTSSSSTAPTKPAAKKKAAKCSKKAKGKKGKRKAAKCKAKKKSKKAKKRS